MIEQTRYWNPYVAGVALGLVLLVSFILTGRGLGASGAFSSVVATGAQAVSPDHARANLSYAKYIKEEDESPLHDWLVYEVLGIMLGGLISAWGAGRVSVSIERGPRVSLRGRLMFAFFGGALMGIGAKFARGCTSGQGLTGGSLMSVGSWAFIVALFIAAYGAARLVRKEWT